MASAMKASSVRPLADGTPAHTIKKFGVVNRYNLKEEFPIMTLRRTYYKSCVDELLWIWQKKSNRVSELGSHVWDQWAMPDGTIGKAYGYQLGIPHQYPEGEFDQVDGCSLSSGTIPPAAVSSPACSILRISMRWRSIPVPTP